MYLQMHYSYVLCSHATAIICQQGEPKKLLTSRTKNWSCTTRPRRFFIKTMKRSLLNACYPIRESKTKLQNLMKCWNWPESQDLDPLLPCGVSISNRYPIIYILEQPHDGGFNVACWATLLQQHYTEMLELFIFLFFLKFLRILAPARHQWSCIYLVKLHLSLGWDVF